jgi:hypothetical protein
MTMTPTITSITATQHAVLTHAIAHHDGKVIWFPDAVKGAAIQKVLGGLATRKLIADPGTGWQVTPPGYEALGLKLPSPMPLIDDPEIEASLTAAEAGWHASQEKRADVRLPSTRQNTKQALVIQMLKRPEGATVIQLMEATGWLNHTVRGTLSAVLHKRLQLTVTSTKTTGSARVYRIA